MSVEIGIISRGDQLEGVLAGLLQHAPIPIRLILEKIDLTSREQMLIETLRHMGSRIAIEPNIDGGLGSGQWQFITSSKADILFYLDDDAVVTTPGGFAEMVNTLYDSSWANFVSPILRFVSNFQENPLPFHREIWDRVREEDIIDIIEIRGAGWYRNYDIGKNKEIDTFCGTCVGFFREDGVKHAEKLRGLNSEPDYLLSKLLSRGITASGVFCYHYGKYTPGKWNWNFMSERMLESHPEDWMKFVKEYRRLKNGQD